MKNTKKKKKKAIMVDTSRDYYLIKTIYFPRVT